MLVVTTWGFLFGCGSNASGQLGLGPRRHIRHADSLRCIIRPVTERVVQAAAGNEHSLILLNTGRVLGSGMAYSGELEERSTRFVDAFMKLPPMRSVQAAGMASALLTRAGTLFVSGYNSWAHFFTPQPVAIQVESFHLTQLAGVVYLVGGHAFRFTRPDPAAATPWMLPAAIAQLLQPGQQHPGQQTPAAHAAHAGQPVLLDSSLNDARLGMLATSSKICVACIV